MVVCFTFVLLFALLVKISLFALKKRTNVLGKKKKGTQNIVKEKKAVPGKVATTCTEDGHKQTAKTSTTI